ncbi:hypothetical protein NR402_14325 [Acidithiobacillus ferrooxidans]|uniref:hypothetical protein n=1 Tax=Acidithiobacillus ferrooxidans TaxID=920 RepID=UPI00214AF371|nr:hypothetical protein [Acidithiobacillus ferrooxidans]MCR2831449.1 hypothetical protein [Acidithiobacillus ferrooxidans]
MTENTPQKAPCIPLFDFTTMGRGIASIQRNQPFIGAAMTKLMKGLDLTPDQISEPLGEVESSLLALTAFDIALDKKAPVMVMMLREHWEHVKEKKPSSVDELATLREVFCLDPGAVNIEFRPKAND